MKTNRDFNIEKNLGVLIFPDGSIYSFGIMRYVPVFSLNEFNYHDSAFMKTLYNKKDFRNKLQSLGVKYNEEYSIHVNSEALASCGIISILNCSSLSSDGAKNKLYAVYIPKKFSGIQLDILNRNYDYLKSIEDNLGYFECMSFDEGINNAWDNYITSVDELYDAVNAKKILRR